MKFREEQIIWKTLEVTTKISFGRYKLGLIALLIIQPRKRLGGPFTAMRQSH